MTNFKIAGFDLPHAQEEDKLRRILSSALKSRTNQTSQLLLKNSCTYWDESYFGLEKVKIFSDSPPQEQAEILRLCNHGLLKEAYFIEKAGVGYMAKMVILAETTEERMLYALFSGDEVTHLAKISSFLENSEIVGTNDPFLRLLEDVVESSDKTVLLFILQVVLEGWGLTHYRSLAKSCQHPELSTVFHSFLQDESRHHGTGVTLFDEVSITKCSQETIIETLALFLQMVQLGPQHIVTAIEQIKGHLSPQQKIKIFQELNTETHSGTRLDLLLSLMKSPNAGTIVQELEARGSFQPFPADKCVVGNW
ncbi:MAG: ferritin-like domain-containing protein [Scytonematopsis contorta HA4267-MV1]|jgi:hypothetical protein|nr:ferritin-like domain-containing protein [Scytonematopsis contorta HA4267-MV1]